MNYNKLFNQECDRLNIILEYFKNSPSHHSTYLLFDLLSLSYSHLFA